MRVGCLTKTGRWVYGQNQSYHPSLQLNYYEVLKGISLLNVITGEIGDQCRQLLDSPKKILLFVSFE
jgi:hypothetical protein